MSIWGMRSWVWNVLEPNPLWVQEDKIRNHAFSFIFTAGDLNSRQHVRIFMSCLITSRTHSSHVSFFNVMINMRTAGGWTADSILHVCWVSSSTCYSHLLYHSWIIGRIWFSNYQINYTLTYKWQGRRKWFRFVRVPCFFFIYRLTTGGFQCLDVRIAYLL